MAVSRRLRYEILRRDDHACRYCGNRAPEVPLTVDHVIPVALGGTDEAGNLVTACNDCNSGKSSVAPDSPIVANVTDDALRWAAALERAAFIQAMAADKVDFYVSELDDFWTDWTIGDTTELVWRPSDWRETFARFYSLGLETYAAKTAIQTAMDNPRISADSKWRYFCGICWKTLNQRQEMAREIIDAESAD